MQHWQERRETAATRDKRGLVAPATGVQQNVAGVEATVYDAALAVEIGQTHEHLVHYSTYSQWRQDWL